LLLFGYSVLAAQIGQAILSAISVVICLLIYETLFPEHVRFRSMVSFVLIVHPHLNYYATVLMSETLFIFLVALGMYFIFQNHKQDCRLSPVFAGLCVGAALMTRANIVFFIPLMALWYLLFSRSSSALRRLLNCIIFSTAVLTITMPWIVRNYITFNAFVPLTTRGGHSFFTRGFNPMSEKERQEVYRKLWRQRQDCVQKVQQGVGKLDAFAPMLSFKPEDLAAMYPEKYRKQFIGTTEIEAEQIYYGYVKTAMQKFRWRILKFFFSNTVHFWDIFGDPIPDKRRFNIFWVFFIPFILIGLWKTVGCWRELAPLYCLVISFTLLFGIAGAENRYRVPLEPLLLLFTGPGLNWLVGRNSRKTVVCSLSIWFFIIVSLYFGSDLVFSFLKSFF